MTKLIELEKDETIKVSSNVINYIKPSVVYIPYENAPILVKPNTITDIGTPLFKSANKIITSPISGIIKNYQKVMTINGEKYALEIINDFKERKKLEPIKKITLNKINKESLEKLLQYQFNISFENKNVLILNAIDDNPYVLTQNFYLLLNYEGFLEILNQFAKIFSLTKVIICLKETSSENINKLLECLGMYPNIELQILPNFYLLGEPLILINYLHLSLSSTLVLNTALLYDIYNLIKRNRQKTDKLITISGTALKEPSIVKVKVGTPLKSLLDNLVILKEPEVTYIAGGLLKGQIIEPENFIIDENLDSILIMPKVPEKREEACIHCGACLNICPVEINPLLLREPNYLKKVQNKCLKCGLCSYICPSYINFNKYLNGGSNE